MRRRSQVKESPKRVANVLQSQVYHKCLKVSVIKKTYEFFCGIYDAVKYPTLEEIFATNICIFHKKKHS